MTDVPPELPAVPAEALTAIADYAEELARWLDEEQAEAARHGHTPGSQQPPIDGWTFVAEALREWVLSKQ